MKLRHAVAAFVFAASASPLLLAQAPRIDGTWDITAETEMPGMPMKIPPTKITECTTKEEAADPLKAMAKGGRGNSNDCKLSDYKVDGNKLTWAVKCTGRQPMTGTGERIYGADSYTGLTKLDMGNGMVMTMKYVAKRTGDCTK